MIFDELIWIDDLLPRSAALNMAIDEALLMQQSAAAIFHTYRWESRSVSFGYFLKWGPVREQYPDWDLVRRWTGGGIVLQIDDARVDERLHADQVALQRPAEGHCVAGLPQREILPRAVQRRSACHLEEGQRSVVGEGVVSTGT